MPPARGSSGDRYKQALEPARFSLSKNEQSFHATLAPARGAYQAGAANFHISNYICNLKYELWPALASPGSWRRGFSFRRSDRFEELVEHRLHIRGQQCAPGRALFFEAYQVDFVY